MADNDVNYCMYHLCAEVDRTSIIDAYTLDDIFLKIQNKLVFVTEYLYFRNAKKIKYEIPKTRKCFFVFRNSYFA